MAELESSNFTNIEEVLGLLPTVDVERAIGSIIAMTGSTIPAANRPNHTKKFYKERKLVLKKSYGYGRSMRSSKKRDFTQNISAG